MNRSESESDDDSGPLYEPSSSDDDIVPKKKKKLRLATIQKMDKAGLSFRQMQKVAEAFIEEFDRDPREYCIAVSTFHLNSTRNRNTEIKGIFLIHMSYEMKYRDSKLVLLFDTKSCKQLNAAHLPIEKRLAIVLHNERSHFGVGISTISNGTAEILSDQLLDITNDFNLANRIIGKNTILLYFLQYTFIEQN